MQELFFELIRVAIGTQPSLSRLPSANEWIELFELAKKQALVGITFVGLKGLGADPDEGYARIGMSEETYFTWAGLAARIQVRNEIVDQQCAEVQRRLFADGLNCCILKGQGIAAYYGELSDFRQSGDIDVWTPHKSILQLVQYVRGYGVEPTTIHAHVSFVPFDDTTVELHPTPSFLRCFWRNRKLQRWFRSFDVTSFEKTNGFTTPPLEFNLVYLLLHMYGHTLYEGIGLRQMMDYFFVLQTSSKVSEVSKFQIAQTIDSFGLKKFTQGVMWIMQSVFGLGEDKLLFEPDPKIGQLLLSEVLSGGNFGHHDKRNEALKSKGLFGKGWGRLKKKFRFISFGFWDIVCSPFWSLWQISWRKVHGYY